MKNLSNIIRSRAARFVSLRVILVLSAAIVFAGFGVTSASATTYFSKAAATDFTSPASWGDVADGSGASPGSVSNADDFVIQNGSAMNLTAGSAAVRTLVINAGSLAISSNTLTVAIASQNNSMLTVNSGGTLTVSGGTLNINGNFVLNTGGTLNQTGGDIVVDGNNGGVAATSVAAGTAITAFNTSTLVAVTMSGGTFTIVDPHAAAASGNVVLTHSGTATGSVGATGSHIFRFGDGVSTDAGGNALGFQYTPWVSTSGFRFANVEFNGASGTNRIFTIGTSFNALVVSGNLTVNSGGDVRHTGTVANSTVYVNGNMTVNSGGSFTCLGTVYFTNASHTSSVAITATASPNAQVVGGSGTYRNLTTPTTPTANFANVQVNSSNATGVTFNALNAITGQPAVSSSVSGTLTFTAGRITTAAGNAMILGTSVPAAGTLAVTAGGFAGGSTYGRWSTAGGTGSVIATTVDPSTTTSRFPFIDASGANRSIWYERTGPTAAGIYAVTYVDAATTSAVSIVDGAYTVQTRYDGNWTFSTLGTSPAATSYEVAIVAPGAYPALNGNGRVTLAAAPAGGVHQAGTATPGNQRATMTHAQLLAGALYIGAANVDLAYASVTSGDWGSGSTWNKGTVPTSTDPVTIANGTTVTITSAFNLLAASALSVTVNPTGNLAISGGSLAVTSTITNNGGITVSGGSLDVGAASGTGVTNAGTFTVSGGTANLGPQDNTVCNRLFTNASGGTLAVGSGTLNIAGRLLINLSSTFNQSGGNINVDGNAGGVSANSIASGVAIVDLNPSTLASINLTGGTLTIVDPHANATASNSMLLTGANNGPVNVTAGHTIRFGNGVSVDPGGNATNGFRVNTWAATTGIPFGNVIVMGPTGTNRYLTGAFQQPILGNVNVNSGGEFRIANAYINGNLTVDSGGIFTSTSALHMRNSTFVDGSTVGFAPSPNAQIIGGAGTYRNLTAGPTANLTALFIQNSNLAGVTLADADKSLSGAPAITFVLGNLNTGANKVILNVGATTSGASSAAGYIVGNLQRNYGATGSLTFDVGTANSYSPAAINITAGAPANMTVSATQGPHPTLTSINALKRYWTVTEGGTVTATMTFTYATDALDVIGNETIYRVVKVEGGTPVNFPEVGCPSLTTPCVNEGSNTMTVPNVTEFSDWTAAEPFAPTNTPAFVSGHVVDNKGAPLAGVTMTLLDTVLVENRTTVTDAKGNYIFNAILTGRQIVVTPSKNGYTFEPQNRSFGHTGDIATVDFVGTNTGQVRSIGSDFDGDGKADLSVFRPSDATWYTLLSSTGVFKAQQWGLGTDRIVPADYDGDHVTDVAVFRPSNGTWYINQSSTSTLRSVNWGLSDDIVTPADFDGDGQADIAVFRPSTGTWYIIDSHNGQNRTIQWGMTGDRPVAADYDGDGKDDVAVWRPSNGIWYVMKSDGTYSNEHWGIEEDRQVVGDYDGDNKADMAVFRPSMATWYVKLSSDNSVQQRGHGTAADILVPGDYDGDGKTDRAVWQTGGDWNILRSTTNTTFGQTWGMSGDIPTTSAYVR